MANCDNGNHHMLDFPPNPPPSSPVPLSLCGFRTGDTVQVRGDTGELQFSVHFSLRKEEQERCFDRNLLEENIPDTGISPRGSVQSSPYLTPTSSTGDFELENQNSDAGRDESFSRGGVVTRLRSSVLSPVKCYSRGIYCVSVGSMSSGKKREWNKGGREGHNVFDKMLKRRDSPLRPCSSYSFFLVKNWAVAKQSSFVETSKRLSRQWSKLPHDVKKVYNKLNSSYCSK